MKIISNLFKWFIENNIYVNKFNKSMVSKYQDFLFESQVIKLISEGVVKSSSNFLDKLKVMSKKNDIAKLLYDIFIDEPYISSDLPQNWIDVSSEDTVSFLSDVKADKIDSDDYSEIYTAKGRSSIKIGRFVKAFLNNDNIKLNLLHRYDKGGFKLTDKDVEEFVNLYKSINIDDAKKFKLVKGDDIPYWYSEENYNSDKGNLGGSCMRDVSDYFFDIYSNNKVCSLLIYINEEKKLLGRALIWKLKKSPCDAKYFMDRIYTANDSDVFKFQQYADEQGWMYKYKQNSDNYSGLLFTYKGKPVFGKIVVELAESEFDSYPYLDTLTFFDEDESLLSNVGFKNGKMLNDTDGGTDVCGDCDGDGKSDCDDCNGNGDISCDTCDGDGDIQCLKCDGDGCKKCDNGYISCSDCNGTGEIECNNCKGIGEIECEECVGLEEEVKRKIKNEKMYPEYKSII